jgi:hypothetical protein
MKLDMHIHTKYSRDCRLEPKDILKIARDKGLDGIAITDHNTIKGGVETKKINKDEDFAVIVGSEIRTNKGEIIGYFLNEEIESRDRWEVMDDIKAQGGIVCLPQPFEIFRRNRVAHIEGVIKHADACEVFNSRCILNWSNRKARRFAEKNNLAMIAGSDAHSSGEIGSAGVIITSKKYDLKKDILKGKRIFGKKSPLYVHLFTTITKLMR